MNVYHRYVSREHDEEYFNGKQEQSKSNKEDFTSENYLKRNSIMSSNLEDMSINIYPLNGQFNTTNNDYAYFHIPMSEWMSVFEYASYFVGYDEIVFGNVLIMVFKNVNTGKLCTRSITKFGFTSFDNLILSSKSRFWPACENLLPEYKLSKIRKSLAITNLKNYSKISNHCGIFPIDSFWDETNAGNLANSMTMIELKSPQDLGVSIMQLGLIQNHTISSLHLDVVYDELELTESNQEENKLISLLGERTDTLFDPLLEYSPEISQIDYNPSKNSVTTKYRANPEIDLIIDELLNVQTNYAMGLVNLLQNFLIPLRIRVMESTDIKGIVKLNKIFPPTIDEITRVNCILHDALNKAQEFGYYEIFSVLNMLVPYFYKPFVRHEANLKQFSLKLKNFYEKHQGRIFENPEINKGGYSIKEIDSIVCGAITELPKLKLIINRLYSAISLDDNIDSKDECTNEQAYKNIINVIDAFGTNDDVEKKDLRSRVFTPTGKILTELASNWPADLQYGWLKRRVIGIFELKNIKPTKNISPVEVLVIFSDYLLFLNILDDTYDTDDSIKQISVSDLLMHSLVNQKPIPNLTQFPLMKVSGWCSITDVFVRSYNSMVDIGEEGEFIKFLSTSAKGFSSQRVMEPTFSKTYQVLNKPGLKQVNKQQIVELVTKAKILNKSQPFHLFKSTQDSFRMFSTAQEIKVYDQENCRSQIALFLNMQVDDLQEYLKINPKLQLIIHARSIDQKNVRITALGKVGNYYIDDTVDHKQFHSLLKEIFTKYLNLFSKFDRDLTLAMVSENDKDIEYIVRKFPTEFQIAKTALHRKHEPPTGLVTDVNNRNLQSLAVTESTKLEPDPENVPAKANKRRRSLFSFIKKAFKKQKLSTENKPEDKRIISATCIPKGEEFHVSHLLLPLPELEIKDDNYVTKSDNGEKTKLQNSFGEEFSDKAWKCLQDHSCDSTYSDLSLSNPSVLRRACHGTDLDANAKGKDKMMDLSNIKTREESNNASLQIDPESPLKNNNDFAPSISEVNILDCTPNIIHYVDLNSKELQQLYSDGSNNWVAMSRDNSSVFNLDPDVIIGQNEAEKTFESKRSSKDKTDPLVDSDIHFKNVDLELTPDQETRVTSNGSSFYFGTYKQEESVQSLTPSMYASNLEMEIDLTFSATKILESGSKSAFTSWSLGKLQKINESRTSLNSTESEFYSPNEYDVNKKYTVDVERHSGDEILELASSEATITVDAIQQSINQLTKQKLEEHHSRSSSGHSEPMNFASMIIQKLRISSGN
jgi:hypothetical protein